jgi:hypothetical protein
MMKNAICQHTLPRCGGGRGLPTFIAAYSFRSSIRLIKRRFLTNLGVAAEEETGVEAAAQETGSSDIDSGGGDQRSRERRGLREF